MNSKQKKVLIITYYWPPSGGSGVQRWLKFTKYLPENGWEPIVLTVNPKKASYFLEDESLNKLVNKDIEVHTTSSFEPLRIASKIIGKKHIPHSGFSNVNKKSLLQKVFKFLRGNLFSVDPRKGWNRYAFKKAEELIIRHNIEYVITTSPPHSSQLIGLALKKKLKVKWIVDVRDPWVDMFYYDELLKLPFLKKKEAKIELEVFNKADKIITVSNGLKQIFEKKIENQEKIHIVENGYDSSDFGEPSKSYHHQLKGEFNITYIGVISDLYDIDSLFEAVKEITKVHKAVHLNFVGLQSEQVKDKVVEFDLNESVSFYPYSKKKDLINYYSQSHALLLAIPDTEDNKGIITGKIFEYICMKIPIIGIGPSDGDAAKIIDEVDAGKLFDYADARGIINYLSSIIEEEYYPTFKNSTRYSRQALTVSLAQILEDLS